MKSFILLLSAFSTVAALAQSPPPAAPPKTEFTYLDDEGGEKCNFAKENGKKGREFLKWGELYQLARDLHAKPVAAMRFMKLWVDKVNTVQNADTKSGLFIKIPANPLIQNKTFTKAASERYNTFLLALADIATRSTRVSEKPQLLAADCQQVKEILNLRQYGSPWPPETGKKAPSPSDKIPELGGAY